MPLGVAPGRPPTGSRAGVREHWAPFAGLVGVVLAIGTALVTGARAGSFVLAGVLLTAAVVRALDPGVGPAGVEVRSRTVDVVLLAGLAAGITLLAATASGV